MSEIGRSWRGGRAVECAGLENRLAREGHGSSNLPLSVRFTQLLQDFVQKEVQKSGLLRQVRHAQIQHPSWPSKERSPPKNRRPCRWAFRLGDGRWRAGGPERYTFSKWRLYRRGFSVVAEPERVLATLPSGSSQAAPSYWDDRRASSCH